MLVWAGMGVNILSIESLCHLAKRLASGIDFWQVERLEKTRRLHRVFKERMSFMDTWKSWTCKV